MRKIILNLAVTLDGFIEGPNGEIDWCSHDDNDLGEGSDFDKFLASVDSIFYGRVSYDLWGQFQPDAEAPPSVKKFWEKIHAKKKYVFSRTPQIDEKAEYISGNITEKVEDIKNQTGENIWLYGGGSLITSFIDLGLVDSYLLAVHPVILGAGKPLFFDIKTRTDLKLNKVVTSQSGVVLLSYDRL